MKGDGEFTRKGEVKLTVAKRGWFREVAESG